MSLEHLSSCNICSSTNIASVDETRHFSQCSDCGYIFDSPRPTQESICAFYSRPMQYDDWLSREREREVLWKRRIRKMRRHRRQGSLLDIGTGIGQFLDLARGYYSEVYGTEVSERAIEIAREKYGLEIAAGDLMEAKLPADVLFDNISMFHVLEHVPNPKQIIERCHSLLCSEGILTIAVPNDVLSGKRLVKKRIKRLLARCGVAKYKDVGPLGLPAIDLDGEMDEVHLSHFTPKVLRRLLEDSGFEIVDCNLDPYFVASGFQSLRSTVYYRLMKFLRVLLRRNFYEAIWVVGRKK
ncbi:MAG: class I SAM-dependent methyltransferase [bacterium]|nr:class I SAM-dependent methyltransferase [bacterium]